jgi:cytochrome c-type biogenesis protein CcmH
MVHLRSLSAPGRRRLLRALALVAAVVVAIVASVRAPSIAIGQSHTQGLEKQGLINMNTDAERQAFTGLACMCGGCPHEPLSSCTCAYADSYRQDIRNMIGKGLSLEQIKAEWVKLYGSEAVTVPPNTGANQFLYVVPLVAIALAAAFLIGVLRHFRRRQDESNRVALAAGPLPSGRDAYDDKLDDELKRLDKDE